MDSNKQYPEITDTSKTKSHHKASEKQVPTAVKTGAKTTAVKQKRKI